MIDNTDRQILEFLQEDSRMSIAAIARKLKMAPSAVLERIRKLKKAGVIRGFTVHLNPRAVGSGLLAYLAIRTNERRTSKNVGDVISMIPEVLEVHAVAGEDSYIVKLRTKDTASLYELLRKRISTNEAVASTKTMIVLHTHKIGAKLPIKPSGHSKPGK